MSGGKLEKRNLKKKQKSRQVGARMDDAMPAVVEELIGCI